MTSAPTRIRYAVAAWLSGMAALAYLSRYSIGVAEKTIRTDLGLTEDQMGLILGAFFWSYALSQIPASRLGARLGTRVCLPVFAAIGSVATALFGVVTWYPLLLTIWMCVGVAQAGAFPMATQTLSVWFPKSERVLATGMLVSMMHVGAAVGTSLTGVLLNWVSWRWLFVAYAIPGIWWSVQFARRYRPPAAATLRLSDAARTATPQENDERAAPEARHPVPWGTLACSWPLWMLCGQQYCRAAGVVFFGSWFATYLQESRQITLTKSGLLLILPHLAIASAGLVGGGLADWIYRRTGRLDWSRKGLSVASMVLCTALIGATYFLRDATLAVAVISLGFFCAGLAGPVAYAVTIDLGGPHTLTFFAIMNMIGNLGAGTLPIVVPPFRRWIQSEPVLLAWSGGDSWNAVIVLIAMLHTVAALCWILLPLMPPRTMQADPQAAKL